LGTKPRFRERSSWGPSRVLSPRRRELGQSQPERTQPLTAESWRTEP
jgi:hypothetical protein